ncbi:hypothetical protein GOBAR_DD12660 [Gossypium barbadense]|nr:hypothetical protein GOBAR_DD12660 [Gossypium barbadense]
MPSIFARKSVRVCTVANLGICEELACDENFNQAAVGIVARESEGMVLLSCSKIYQPIASAFATEVLMCRKAIQIGIDMHWEKVIIEGDSLSIIKKLVVYLVGGVPEYAEEQEERDRVREPD